MPSRKHYKVARSDTVDFSKYCLTLWFRSLRNPTATLLTLVWAAKSSAGELKKTKSRLRIPQRPQLCLLQRHRGRAVKKRWVDSFRYTPTDGYDYSAGSPVTSNRTFLIRMSVDQTSTAKRHTRVSTCWLLNPNRLATHVVAHRLATVAVSKWLWVLSEVLNFNDDRWCAHVCLCVAVRSRLELLSLCLYNAQRNQRCPLSNYFSLLLSSKGSIFAEFTLQTVCSYGCSDPVLLKWNERRY